MFTALVLICLNGDINDKCFVSKHPVVFETKESCMEMIVMGVRSGIFSGNDPDTKKKWYPTEWECVDWSRKEV